MKTSKKIMFAAVILGLVLGFAVDNYSARADASAIVGNDYRSLEISASNASTTPIVVKAGSGSLGSIIIASSTPGAYFRVYDNAVSTSSATSTRIVSFPVSAVAGTYVFDREITRGIVIDAPPAFNGSYVVTYR